MLDVIVIIVGVYFLIKYFREQKSLKKTDEEIAIWVKNVSEIRNKMTNYDLEQKYDRPIEYGKLREEIIIPIIAKTVPIERIKCDGFFKEHESKYANDKSYGKKYITDWRIEAMYAAVKLSEQGYVPRSWFLTSGMQFGIYTCYGQMIKESIAIAKKVQQNLRANGIYYHVCLLKKYNADGTRTGTEEYGNCYVCLQETCSKIEDTIRVDDIP